MTAPTNAPASYEQALAAAAAIVAARSAKPDPVVTLTATAEQTAATIDTASTWAKAMIRQLWLTVDPYNAAQVKAFTERAASLMESAQTAVARMAAAGTQQSLASLGILIQAAPSNPLDIRAPGATLKKGLLALQRHSVSVDYSGADGPAKLTRADMTTRGIFNRPAALYRWAQSQGNPNAADLALGRIDNLVDTNLMLAHRFASQEMIVRAANLDDTGKRSRGRRGVKVIGYRRVIHPELSRTGTCGMCIVASDRIYHVAELLPIHGGCNCTIAAVTEDYDPADDLNAIDLGQIYKQSGGTSAAHLKRTRYKVDEHGELGAVLVPDKKYNPRSAAGKRAAAAIAPSEPESKADIAHRHLPILEANLAKIREAGAAEDSPQVTYHKSTIARMQDDLAADARKARSSTGSRSEKAPKTAAGAGGGGKPPQPPKASSPAAGDNPEDRMNALFAGQADGATAGQKDLAARWQSLDRYYEQVQAAAVDDPSASEDSIAVAEGLRRLTLPLPEDVQVWRGIRSIEATFGTGIEQVAGRPDEIMRRFLSTSVHEQVARDEFTQPGRNPAMLKITAKAGVKAVWMPPLGDPTMAYQGELLFQTGALLRIVDVDTSGEVPVIEVEVSRP
ncbi:hypothetical protein EV580_1325 [Mycobacterium sp. BK086]|uniref:hypothetical protein n=1 Tax=Mycobacterium sp. BK086 TaxID=2512165 RepID=UPI00105CAAEF|nr:hypothetical protein [Mycobacterium sp. BK086]TDO18143.1 hypothetical protein EV580_1325 [Mycobacterium sp. BK086]